MLPGAQKAAEARVRDAETGLRPEFLNPIFLRMGTRLHPVVCCNLPTG